jgi:hypothetical protein
LSKHKKQALKFKKPIKNKRNIDVSFNYYSNLDGSIKSARESFSINNPKFNLDKKMNIFNNSVETTETQNSNQFKCDYSNFKKDFKK